MHYNLKDTRSGKSISKVALFPSLRALVLKNKVSKSVSNLFKVASHPNFGKKNI